jgi:hypothetical protein
MTHNRTFQELRLTPPRAHRRKRGRPIVPCEEKSRSRSSFIRVCVSERGRTLGRRTGNIEYCYGTGLLGEFKMQKSSAPTSATAKDTARSLYFNRRQCQPNNDHGIPLLCYTCSIINPSIHPPDPYHDSHLALPYDDCRDRAPTATFCGVGLCALGDDLPDDRDKG